MKKTIIALIVMSGSVFADTYNYTGNNNDGANEGWFESKRNWTNAATNEKFGSGGDSVSANDVKNIFVIQGNKSVLAGTGTHKLEGATVIIKSGSTLGFTTHIGAANITVEDGATLNLGDDRKCNGTVITTNSALTIGNTWFDGNSNCGSVTFNLGNAGVVNYGKVTHNAQAWNGSITLSANCINGALNGNGEIQLFERTLLTATSFAAADGTSSTMEAIMRDHVKGGAITLDGIAMSYTAEAFNADALSAENVGQYRFVYADNSIKVQYAAYTIPEPTTATLSLLALAGLAARRRRR